MIVGPTASGKSDLAVKLAKKIGGEIVSADSRQIYRGLDIGSGKLEVGARQGVTHYMLDVASPKRRYTAAQYTKQAQKIIKQIISHGQVPIVVGGTGFYIDSLLGNFSLPPVPPNKKLRQRLERLTALELFKKLKKLDPIRAQSIDHHNSRRLIRAIEIATALGHVPSLKKQNNYDALWLGLNPPWSKLQKNIRQRLGQRLKQGLVVEVKRLHHNGLSWQRLDDLGLEYRYVSLYLRKQISKKELVKKLEKEITSYAKRQKRWWKKNKNIIWLNQNKLRSAEKRTRTHFAKTV